MPSEGSSPDSETLPAPATVGSMLGYLIGSDWKGDCILRWPPDVFAVATFLLDQSGGYLWVRRRGWAPDVSAEPPERDDSAHRKSRREKGWALFVRSVGTSWAEGFNVETIEASPPDEVRQWWRHVVAAAALPMREAGKDQTFCFALLQLSAAADEACCGCGIPTSPTAWPGSGNSGHTNFRREISFQLYQQASDKSMATLCKRIDPIKLVVLPKTHTSQSGLTIRSLSHHLALISCCGVRSVWHDISSTPLGLKHALNLLLIPWPRFIYPSFFYSTDGRGHPYAPNHHFFAFDNGDPPAVELVKAYLSQAKKQIGRVHGLILPEMAMSTGEYETIRDAVLDDLLFLVGGIYECPRGESEGRNYAGLSVSFEPVPNAHLSWHMEQDKHHAWYLDGGQIHQYGLGGVLDPRYRWREDIELTGRVLNFAALAGWLSMAVLICEDLARPDPVASIIRAVGPNLLIALLQDGPQLERRWPGRYATVLADDPGCSVLTLSSIGMAELSRPPGLAPSRVVALWKDHHHAAREIELPKGAGALVLSLANRRDEEWTADGRSDGGAAGFLSLYGVHPLMEEKG